MIASGGPTCYYRQGKIHRSDAGQCWRVFRKASDRCDLGKAILQSHGRGLLLLLRKLSHKLVEIKRVQLS